MIRSVYSRTGAAWLAAVTATTALASADAGPLDAERWKTRPLIVVASAFDSPMLAGIRTQMKRLDMRAAFDERAMVLYIVVGDEARRGEVPLPAGQAAALRRVLSLDAAAPAQAVLVGLDGGVKLRQFDRVDLTAIFATIDGMPMRRR